MLPHTVKSAKTPALLRNHDGFLSWLKPFWRAIWGQKKKKKLKKLHTLWSNNFLEITCRHWEWENHQRFLQDLYTRVIFQVLFIMGETETSQRCKTSSSLTELEQVQWLCCKHSIIWLFTRLIPKLAPLPSVWKEKENFMMDLEHLMCQRNRDFS